MTFVYKSARTVLRAFRGFVLITIQMLLDKYYPVCLSNVVDGVLSWIIEGETLPNYDDEVECFDSDELGLFIRLR